MKVAVHVMRYVTKSGHQSMHPRWHVFEGLDPSGPRGGHQGTCVNGKWILGPFRTCAEADKKAAEYAEIKGYELLV